MSESKKKIQVAKISIFITSIFVIFLSVTYAFINLTLAGTRRQVITVGDLKLYLQEDKELTLSDAFPMYDEVGLIQDSYDFRLVNESKKDVEYILQLEDVTKTENKLATNIVKYGLTKDNATPKVNYLSAVETNDLIIDEGTIFKNTTIHYSLRLWIDSEVTDNNQIKNKSLSYRIHVETGQISEIKFQEQIGMMKQISSDYSEGFYQYKTSISSIVIEPTINIPEGIEKGKSWDMSANGDKTVMAYIEDDGTQTDNYKLHIQGTDQVYANKDSSYLFDSFTSLKNIEGIEHLDTSKVENMNYMFNNCTSLESLEVGHFDTSNVITMVRLFHECSKLTTLSVENWNVSKVNNFQGIFRNCSNLIELNVSSWVTDSATNMQDMFDGCSSLTSLDVNSFNTKNVTTMQGMFQLCRGLTNLNIENFVTDKVTSMHVMFSRCSGLTTLNVKNFNTSQVVNMSLMFYGCNSLQTIEGIENFQTENVVDMSKIFSAEDDQNPMKLTSLNIGGWNTQNAIYMSSMFNGCSQLTNLDLSNWKTENAENIAGLFRNCTSLQSVNLTGWKTSKVKNMNALFSKDSQLTTISGIEDFDTSQVTNMQAVFGATIVSRLDLSRWVTDKVTNMESMFNGCEVTYLNLTNWDTKNVENMSSLFRYCTKLTKIEGLENFNTENVTKMQMMFSGCRIIENLNLTNFNTKKVADMKWMFDNCLRLTTLNLSSFDTSNVEDMSYMFEKDSLLTTITYGEHFVHKEGALTVDMFNECKAQKPSGTTWENITDWE